MSPQAEPKRPHVETDPIVPVCLEEGCGHPESSHEARGCVGFEDVPCKANCMKFVGTLKPEPSVNGPLKGGENPDLRIDAIKGRDKKAL